MPPVVPPTVVTNRDGKTNTLDFSPWGMSPPPVIGPLPPNFFFLDSPAISFSPPTGGIRFGIGPIGTELKGQGLKLFTWKTGDKNRTIVGDDNPIPPISWAAGNFLPNAGPWHGMSENPDGTRTFKNMDSLLSGTNNLVEGSKLTIFYQPLAVAPETNWVAFTFYQFGSNAPGGMMRSNATKVSWTIHNNGSSGWSATDAFYRQTVGTQMRNITLVPNADLPRGIGATFQGSVELMVIGISNGISGVLESRTSLDTGNWETEGNNFSGTSIGVQTINFNPDGRTNLFFRVRRIDNNDYSATFGWYTCTIPAQGVRLVANQLDPWDPRVGSIFKGAATSTYIAKYDNGDGVWVTNSFDGTSWTDESIALLPGEGGLFYNPSANAIQVTFSGQVLAGGLTVYCPSGHNILSFPFSKSSSGAGFPARIGDKIHKYSSGWVTYTATNSVNISTNAGDIPPIGDGGTGYVTNYVWAPDMPTFACGESFFVERVTGNTNAYWWPVSGPEVYPSAIGPYGSCPSTSYSVDESFLSAPPNTAPPGQLGSTNWIGVRGIPGTSYDLLATTDMSTWTTTQENIAVGNNRLTWVPVVITDPSKRFYRFKWRPPVGW